MSCKTEISSISASTYKFCLRLAAFYALSAQANLEGSRWVFHTPKKDYTFKRAGELTGSPLVLLAEICESLEFSCHPGISPLKTVIENPRNKKSAEISIESRQSKIFYGTVELSRAPIKVKEHILVPIDIADRVLTPLLTGVAPSLPKSTESLFQVDVVLDPGHGGNDYGAHIQVGKDWIREKDLTLTLSRELKRSLEKAGLRVMLTRDTDSYLTLHERTQIANRLGAKFFLSLHLNSDPQNKSRGYEVYILSLTPNEEKVRNYVARENQNIPMDLPSGVEKAIADLKAESNLEDSLKWAKIISTSLQKFTPPFGRPVKMGPFYVLYGANMPAALAEFGFLTNEADRIQLRSPTARAKVIKELATLLAAELKKGIVSSP